MGRESAGCTRHDVLLFSGISLTNGGLFLYSGRGFARADHHRPARTGHRLGGIQPSQADYMAGDPRARAWHLHVLVFAPSTIQEMVDMVFEAFDLADCYRVPAMILADGMLGQMMEPVTFPEKEVKQYDKDSWATNGHQGKRRHNIVNSLYLKPDQLENKVIERFERYKVIEEKHTKYEEIPCGRRGNCSCGLRRDFPYCQKRG
jgi:2-oxoglutarate ferredoxin oxidoreductase subunit alpha